MHSTTSASRNDSPPRPYLVRENSLQTHYMSMLLELEAIPSLYNIYASFFAWILLAGFIIFPSTFTSLGGLDENPTISSSQVAADVVQEIKSVPLLYLAAFCSGIGAVGMIWLWIRYRSNYVWLLNRIFLPGCLQSLTGLISTLVNVYSQQSGHWSVTAWATAAATGGAMGITGFLFVLYHFSMLARVKKIHQEEMEQFNKVGYGAQESIKYRRAARRSAFYVGDVV